MDNFPCLRNISIPKFEDDISSGNPSGGGGSDPYLLDDLESVIIDDNSQPIEIV